MRRTTASAACVLALTMPFLGGCGGDDSDTDSDRDAGLSGAADQTVCTADATPVASPYDAHFPTSWTFPPQTVVYNVEDRAEVGVIVTGVTSSPFKDVLDYLNKTITTAGFSFNNGETEEDDAESNWTGAGFTGRWTIRKSATCAGETVIQVFASTRA